MLGLDPATGTNVLFVDITGLMIGVFGYSYACVAYDPHRYRVYVSLGVIGKLAVVGIIGWSWAAGIVSSRLPALAAGDLVFASLFVDYLRRSRRTEGIEGGQGMMGG